ncbi:MAG: transposase [Caulobacteraceae bacterium]
MERSYSGARSSGRRWPNARRKLMTLSADEFIRRFLIHVLPGGFHRIRHYGLFANGGRAANLAKLRALLQPSLPPPGDDAQAGPNPHRCAHVPAVAAACSSSRSSSAAPHLVRRLPDR